MHHLLSVMNLDSETILSLVSRGIEICEPGLEMSKPLADKVVGILFKGPSTRTRTAFSVAAIQLGADIITYGPKDLQLSTGETPLDTARVLGSYIDALVVRTNASDAEMEAMARQGEMPVINAMSESEHPTQVIGDLITMKEAFGKLDGLEILYMGEGNNTAASLALITAKLPGNRLVLVTPPGYGLAPRILEEARRIARGTGSEISQHHDMSALPAGVDVVYTTRWETMGVAHPDGWREVFAPYKVTTSVMDRVSKSNTIFMHDLPAIREMEVEDAVLDGERSLAFRQAYHKLTSAKAVLEWCMEP